MDANTTSKDNQNLESDNQEAADTKEDAYPDSKSHVLPSGRPATKPREFEDGERVNLPAVRGNFNYTDTGLIANHRQSVGGKHEYQAKDELTGKLVGNGRWFKETELDFAS